MTEQEYLDEQYKRVKPCPFCGSERVYVSRGTNTGESSIICDNCMAEGPIKKMELFDEHQNAFEAWNWRPKEAYLMQEYDEVRSDNIDLAWDNAELAKRV